MKSLAKISYQTVDARIKLSALAFSVFCDTVINGMRFIKLLYLFICVTTCQELIS